MDDLKDMNETYSMTFASYNSLPRRYRKQFTKAQLVKFSNKEKKKLLKQFEKSEDNPNIPLDEVHAAKNLKRIIQLRTNDLLEKPQPDHD